jgi:hypothetical protein
MYLWIYFYLVKYYNSLLFVYLEKANDDETMSDPQMCQCTFPSGAYYGLRYPASQFCPQDMFVCGVGEMYEYKFCLNKNHD